jgi:hypothetical protein
MSLPNDIARCDGKDWDPFGVQPECIDCARRIAPRSQWPTTYMEPPSEFPCPMKIREEVDA